MTTYRLRAVREQVGAVAGLAAVAFHAVMNLAESV